MKLTPLLSIAKASMLMLIGASSHAHDDSASREKEFWFGYRAGFITAVRESAEGASMCTKNVPLLEVIQTLGTYNKAKGIAPEAALTVKNITDALSAKYACPNK